MVSRNPAGDVVFEPNKMYKLSDLNELESGLGDKVFRLVDGIQNYSRLQTVRREMDGLLGQYGFKNSEVYIEKGSAFGETIETCFKNCADNFQFADQFDM